MKQLRAHANPLLQHRYRRLTPTLAALPLLVTQLTGCGGGQSIQSKIDQRWQWDGGNEAAQLLTRIEGKLGPKQEEVAIGVTGFGLHGRAPGAKTSWSYEAAVDVLPSIVGDAVVFTGDGMIHALEAKTGRLLFKTSSAGRRLEGAGYDGTYFALLLVDEDDARRDEVRFFSRSGTEVRSIAVDARLGTPAVIDGVALVPYGRQYVAGFEIATGKWLGRILYRDALHAVTANESGALVWGKGVTSLRKELSTEPDSRSLTLDLEPFPGSPVWPVDGSKPRPARAAPINVLAAPQRAEGRLSFAEDAYITTYYQIVLSEQVDTHELNWVASLPKSIVGAALSKTHLSVCLEDGSLLRLDLKDGSETKTGSLESRVKACVVSAASSSRDNLQRPELREQIVETIRATGPDMARVQTVLLDRLAELQGRPTTIALLSIAQDPLISSELARHAGQLLADQREGGEEMVRALSEFTQLRADRLKQAQRANKPGEAKDTHLAEPPKDTLGATPAQPDSPASTDDEWADDTKEQGSVAPHAATVDPADSSTPGQSTPEADPSEPATANATLQKVPPRLAKRPPPVAALARALRKLKTPGAAAALSHYLTDPALSATEVQTVMNTVFELGGPNEAQAVHQFVISYKNTGGEDELLDALAQGVEFLLVHLPAEERKNIKAEINESLTHPDLKRRARRIKIRRIVKKTEKPETKEPKTP